jgi:NAD(P)-dependent dehydrogenase (short-subunit alcohol dehydrogenase family)
MGTMKPDFAGDVALVTGSAGGMGRAIVLAFAAAGATVVTADVDATGGQETERLAREAGGSADFIPTDIAEPDAVEALVSTAADRYGGPRYAATQPPSRTRRPRCTSATSTRSARMQTVNVRSCA